MIGKLKGIIDTIDKDSLLLDVGGVCYAVFCSARTLRALPGSGEAAVLVIETHVREDHIHLYGFTDNGEREWFRLLTTVKGVGSKMALAILSVLSPTQITTAVALQDKSAFRQASGVGPKLAERLLVELKDKSVGDGEFVPSSVIENTPHNQAADAVSALVNLGYNRTEAAQAVGKLLGQDASLGIGELIRKALKELAK